MTTLTMNFAASRLLVATGEGNGNTRREAARINTLHAIRFSKRCFLACSAAVIFEAPLSAARNAPPTAAIESIGSAGKDGQHDFDFEIGRWRTHISRLTHPRTGSAIWAEYDGLTVVRQIWDGHANLEEITVDGAAGRLEVLSLRLYNPAARQWSLNVASSQNGSLGVPIVGEFKNGRGEFFTDETVNSRPIMIRFIVSDITPESFRFERASLAEGSKTWEVSNTGVPLGDRARFGKERCRWIVAR